MSFIYADTAAFPGFQDSLETQEAPLKNYASSGAETIKRTTAQISVALSAAQDTEHQCYEALVAAQAALAAAESRTEQENARREADQPPAVTPEFYYDNVATAEAAYQEARYVVESIAAIEAEYQNYALRYRTEQDELLLRFKELLSRSRSFFEEYADLLQKARDAISDDSTSSAGVSGIIHTALGSFQAVQYTGTVTVGGNAVSVSRQVIQYCEIDPAMVISAGTRYANGLTLNSDTTNLDLMKNGQAPFVLENGKDGSPTLSQITLHHLTGQEELGYKQYSSNSKVEGSLLELSTEKHQKYTKQLHIPGPSFRKNEDGTKSIQDKQFNNFREAYWKWRADQFEQK